jgi:predicted DNA-binding protein with PD1-like motif
MLCQARGCAPAIHVHCVLGRRDYSAVAGHLLKAGLALIDLDASTAT